LKTITFQMGVDEIEIEADETGRIEGVWVGDGINYADKTVEELVIAALGGCEKFMRLLSQEILNSKDA